MIKWAQNGSQINGPHLFGTHMGPILFFGAFLRPIWSPVGPFWHHFGVLEPPVAALCDLVGRHCRHGRVWVRFEG